MYRIHMVEDEDEAAERLRGMLLRYADERGLDFHVTRDASALPLMEDRPSYDLVFMDIQLPGIDGMECAEFLRQYDQTTPLIFVTNLAQYAVRGYEVDALDFVVKPVSYGSLCPKLDRALRVVDRTRGRTVSVRTRDGLRVIPLADLVCVEVRNHDLVFRVMGEEGEPLAQRGSLSALEEELAGAPFVRVSQSCLANMGLIRRVRKDELAMADGSTLYFSRAKRRPAMERIADYLGGSV